MGTGALQVGRGPDVIQAQQGGIQCNPASGNHPNKTVASNRHRYTERNSVENTHLTRYLPKPTNQEGERDGSQNPRLFRLRRYIKHSRQCFIGFPNTSNFVKNTPLYVVFSIIFFFFLKHYLSCLINYLKKNCNFSV